MKHFILRGPETQREFDIEDDEMVILKVHKIDDYTLYEDDAPKQETQNDRISNVC